MQQPASDLQTALHAAGEGVHEARAPLPEPDHLHHLSHPRSDHLAGHAVQLRVQPHVLLGGEVAVERRVLEDQADVASHRVPFADDVVAPDGGRAAGGTHERAQHADGGRLPGAVWAQEAERLAAAHLEVDAATASRSPYRFTRPSTRTAGARTSRWPLLDTPATIAIRDRCAAAAAPPRWRGPAAAARPRRAVAGTRGPRAAPPPGAGACGRSRSRAPRCADCESRRSSKSPPAPDMRAVLV